MVERDCDIRKRRLAAAPLAARIRQNSERSFGIVTAAEAGVQDAPANCWIPACAGMTDVDSQVH